MAQPESGAPSHFCTPHTHKEPFSGSSECALMPHDWNRQTERQSPPAKWLARQPLLLMFPSVALKSILTFDSLRCVTIKTSQNCYQLWNVNGLGGGAYICAPRPWSPICGFRMKTVISVEVSLSLHRHWEIKEVRASWREHPGGVTWLSAGSAGCEHN